MPLSHPAVEDEGLRRSLTGSVDLDEARRALAVAEIAMANAVGDVDTPLVSAALILVKRAQRILAEAAA